MESRTHAHIVERIEELIKSGKLKPGDKIPSERSLAESFSVSRNTVREAIRSLAEKAVLESRRGSGTFVAEGALACMIDSVTRRRHRLKEVFELRQMLEPQIARIAAAKISPEELSALEEVVHQQDKAACSGKDTVALDELFHRLVVRATGNSVLLDVYETLHDVLAESRTRELQSPERILGSLENHRALISALRKNDPEGAAEIMSRHMVQVEKDLGLIMPAP